MILLERKNISYLQISSNTTRIKAKGNQEKGNVLHPSPNTVYIGLNEYIKGLYDNLLLIYLKKLLQVLNLFILFYHLILYLFLKGYYFTDQSSIYLMFIFLVRSVESLLISFLWLGSQNCSDKSSVTSQFEHKLIFKVKLINPNIFYVQKKKIFSRSFTALIQKFSNQLCKIRKNFQ